MERASALGVDGRPIPRAMPWAGMGSGRCPFQSLDSQRLIGALVWGRDVAPFSSLVWFAQLVVRGAAWEV